MSIYEEITQKIVEQLDGGRIPWESGILSAGGVISHSTGKPYSFLNQMLLGARPGEYATFNQIKKEGGHVIKGERSSRILFFKMVVKKDRNDDGEEEIRDVFPVLKHFIVFNLNQCEGVERKFKSDEIPEVADWQRSVLADRTVNQYAERTNLKIVHEKINVPYYRPDNDSVHIPSDEQFKNMKSYYESLFHELGHSTGHRSRLNRKLDGKHGGKDYAREELVAEMTSSFLCGWFGFEKEFKNQAAYIQSWRQAIIDDERLMVIASCRAEKACKLILNMLEQNED